jgi:LacI family transcriptional regulator
MATNMQGSGRSTIHDIARELGVSARTVSRVLNDLPGVSPKTRARVAAYVQEAGYQPHSGARSLRSHKIDCIGVSLASPPEVVPLSQDLLGWLFGELYRLFGIHGEFISFDLHTMPVNGFRDYARGIWQQRFGATVLAGAFADDDTILRRVHLSGHPYVALARLDTMPEANTAAVDYEEGAYLSTQFLLSRGHRRIGMLMAMLGYQPGTERLRGYRRAHEEAGVPVDEQIIRQTPFRAGELATLTHQLLNDRSVTGLVDCSGAEDSASLRSGAARSGRSLGKDVEVVVWTYTYGATVMAEASAHLWLPVREASCEGLERLAAQVYGKSKEPFQVVYRPQLLMPPYDVEIPPRQPVFTVGR